MIELLYTDFFFAMALTFMAGALTYLVMKYQFSINAKSMKLFAATILFGLFLFYFVIPVPATVQAGFIQIVREMKQDNKAFKPLYTQAAQRELCSDGYLNAYRFFLIKEGYWKDFDAALEKQGSLMLPLSKDHSEVSPQKICDTKL